MIGLEDDKLRLRKLSDFRRFKLPTLWFCFCRSVHSFTLPAFVCLLLTRWLVAWVYQLEIGISSSSERLHRKGERRDHLSRRAARGTGGKKTSGVLSFPYCWINQGKPSISQ